MPLRVLCLLVVLVGGGWGCAGRTTASRPSNRAWADVTPLDTALLRAAGAGRYHEVVALVGQGAYPQTTDREGRTALHELVRAGPPPAARDDLRAAMRVLLDAGADVDARDGEGRTPLMQLGAVLRWHPDPPAVADVLLQAGANPNARDDQGRTPLHHAVSGAAARPADRQVLALLVARGADPFLVNPGTGRTPLETAEVRNRPVADMLRPTMKDLWRDAGRDAEPTVRQFLVGVLGDDSAQMYEQLLPEADRERWDALAARLRELFEDRPEALLAVGDIWSDRRFAVTYLNRPDQTRHAVCLILMRFPDGAYRVIDVDLRHERTRPDRLLGRVARRFEGYRNGVFHRAGRTEELVVRPGGGFGSDVRLARGPLEVSARGGALVLDFPTRETTAEVHPDQVRVYTDRDLLLFRRVSYQYKDLLIELRDGQAILHREPSRLVLRVVDGRVHLLGRARPVSAERLVIDLATLRGVPLDEEPDASVKDAAKREVIPLPRRPGVGR